MKHIYRGYIGRYLALVDAEEVMKFVICRVLFFLSSGLVLVVNENYGVAGLDARDILEVRARLRNLSGIVVYFSYAKCPY